MDRVAIWTGIDDWRAEAARVELDPQGVRATGTQIGADALPYRLDYELEAADGFVTSRLWLRAEGGGWWRRLELTHDDGEWSADHEVAGEVDLPAPKADVGGLVDALDCDLALSPLTNLMPIRRHNLHEGPGEREFTMAFVSVPELAVQASRQRYEHVRAGGDGAVVRFHDLGLFEGFTADLELDPDGLVRVYPGLARRV
jgi:hypothetical protein